MIQVNIQGYGTFHISNEKVQELLNWLQQNDGVRNAQYNENNTRASFRGNELLVE